MPSPRISAEDAALMRAEYEAPHKPSLEAMAHRWGWSRDAITCAIKRAGGTIRPPRWCRKYPPASKLLTLREHGMSRAEIVALHGVSFATLDGMLSRARRTRRAEART